MIPLWLRLWNFNGHYAKQTGEMESNILAIGYWMYINNKYIYIYIYIIWHSIWQSSWHTDIPSGILSCILLGILSDIYSDILSGFYLTHILTFYLALCGILSDIWRSLLRPGSAHWHLPLAVEEVEEEAGGMQPWQVGKYRTDKEWIVFASPCPNAPWNYGIFTNLPTFAQKTTHWLLYWHVTACKGHPIFKVSRYFHKQKSLANLKKMEKLSIPV